MNKFEHTVLRIDNHTSVYRGFTINRCPRNRMAMRTPYRIFKDGHYYGCDFALAEAVKTINKLHKGY